MKRRRSAADSAPNSPRISIAARVCPGLLCAVMTMLLVPGLSWAQDAQSLLVEDFLNWQQRISAIEQRVENGVGANDFVELLENFADDHAIAVQTEEVRREEEFHSYGSNVRFLIPGANEARIALFISYVTQEGNPLSFDNGGVLSAVLALLENASLSSMDLTLEVNFLGSIDGQKGLREYLTRNSATIPQVALVLESGPDLSQQLNIINGGDGIVSPLWLIRHSLSALNENALPGGLDNSRTQLYRLEQGGASAITPLLNAEINALGLRFQNSTGLFGAKNASNTTDTEETTREDDAEHRDLEQKLAFLSEMLFFSPDPELMHEMDITGQWDQHYLSIAFPFGTHIIGEQLYLYSMFALSCFLILWLNSFRRRRQKYFQTLGRNFWNLPLLYAALFGFIFLGSLVVSAVEGIRGVEQLWQYTPIPLLLLKITTALFLFTLLFTVLHRIPLSKNGSFYSASAVLFLSLDVIIFGMLNISFSYYFLWALFWGFLFSLSRHRVFKVISALASPLLFILDIIHSIRLGELRFAGQLIGDDPGINLLVAFILLPYLFMLIRLDFLFPHPSRGKKNFTLRYSAVFMAAVFAASFLMAMLAKPFTPESPQPVNILIEAKRSLSLPDAGDQLFWPAAAELLDDQEEKISMLASMSVSSPGRLGTIESDVLGHHIELQSRFRSAVIGQFQQDAHISVEASREDFLGRSSYRLEFFSPTYRVMNYRISLFTDSDTSLYDANLPYRFTTGTGRIEFLNGIHPPNPMILEFTLPTGVSPRLIVEGNLEIDQHVPIAHRDSAFVNVYAREQISLESDL